MKYQNITGEDYAKIISSYDDCMCDHIIWFADDGNVYCDPLGVKGWEVFAASRPNYKFFWAILRRGNGYVGQEASNDLAYCNLIAKQINELLNDPDFALMEFNPGN